MIVKVNSKSGDTFMENMKKFPFFTLKCKLNEVLKERGLTQTELSELTGIRPASISELANMKRSTINVPHLLVIAQTLRITDLCELIEFRMPEYDYVDFIKDQKIIEKNGLLPEQESYLEKLREEKKKTTVK